MRTEVNVKTGESTQHPDAPPSLENNELRMQNWKAEMSVTDEKMPQYVEDIWDVIGTEGAKQETKDQLVDKKAIRARKP